MEIHAYMEAAMRTLAPRVEEGDLTIFADPRAAMHWNALSGLASEVGEINEIYKKHYFHFHEWTEETEIHAKKEVGDLLWYVMLLCFSNGWDPVEIMQVNIDKLKARYPEGFSTERSVNRSADDV
jgi:NTP pyrophosphatase (non-canonical NTP hydrolase)